MKITSGIKPRCRRIMLYGCHGTGKSTWASKSPKPIFINLEDGLDDIECDKTEMLKSPEAVREALHWLLTAQHQYQTCVIDTVDWLELVHNRDVCNQAGVESLTDGALGFGKGNQKAFARWYAVLDLLSKIQQRGLGIILISHAKIEKYKPADEDSYDKYAPDLYQQTSMLLQEWCDDVLFCQFKVFVTAIDDGIKKTRGRASGGKEVVIRTSETPYAYAKNRVSKMPIELPMEFAAYAQCVREHYARAKKGNIEAIVVEGSSKPIDKDQLADEVKLNEEVEAMLSVG